MDVGMRSDDSNGRWRNPKYDGEQLVISDFGDGVLPGSMMIPPTRGFVVRIIFRKVGKFG